LEAFLAAPAKVAPGTRMVVSVSKAEDRAALIRYLTAPGK
jgi:cytochrome c2